MNRLTLILFISIFLSISYACKKDDPAATTIIGRWELREVYDSGQMNGDPQWQTISPEFRHVWEFQSEDNFIKIELRGNPLPDTCTGTYLLLSDSQLQYTSSCQVIINTVEISLTSQTLIFTYIGREGNVYEKYVKIE